MIKSQDNSTSLNPPLHLGFIVDGNRRWARERDLPTLEGHRKGFKKVEMVIEELAKAKIPFASFYLFSTENWNRSPEEVSYLMELIQANLRSLSKKLKTLNLRCLILGHPQCARPDIWQKLQNLAASTASNTAGTIAICFNYGGQQEIVDAVNRLDPSRIGQITLTEFASHLYHPEVPPVDMIIRTSGEQRLSGFMLWRAAYSEFHFLPKYFPELTPKDVTDIIAEYHSRHRRFGK